MAHPPSSTVDPASDAAALLRRLGFGILMLLVPAAALVTRRGLIILAPIGIFLIVIAATLDATYRSVGSSFASLVRSRAARAGAVLLLWAALSLIWTPFPSPGSERLINIVATIGMAVAGYLAIPDRMRSANLYLIPLGVAFAAAFGIMIGLFGSASQRGATEAGQNLDRGLTVLAVVVWPAIAWLRSRGRRAEALGIAVLVAIAVVIGPQPVPAVALTIGAVGFALTAVRRRFGVTATALVTAGLLALAPLLPFVLRPFAASLVFGEPFRRTVAIWRNIIINEPVRLVTGHGFETALRGRFDGLLAVNAPSTLLFELWYELGIVGAWAGAFALYSGLLASDRNHPSLVPGIVAAFVTAFAFACLGIGAAQIWWLTALAVVTLLFVATERGQFRTSRPKARLMQPARA